MFVCLFLSKIYGKAENDLHFKKTTPWFLHSLIGQPNECQKVVTHLTQLTDLSFITGKTIEKDDEGEEEKASAIMPLAWF